MHATQNGHTEDIRQMFFHVPTTQLMTLNPRCSIRLSNVFAVTSRASLMPHQQCMTSGISMSEVSRCPCKQRASTIWSQLFT
uniref:Uncharacterized protein n=1 Tax=Steinernema glaseri TaxID=37863 RepID=A0A1I7XYP1_9BILA